MKISLILASASPRRAELLGQIGITPIIQAADIDETPIANESGIELVERLAFEKCHAIESKDAVLAADTMVVRGNRIYGKPESQAHGIDMLLSLAGETHTVLTSVCLKYQERVLKNTVRTDVVFTDFGHDIAQKYWATGECRGKAGSYAIQGMGAVFVERINGSYSNVMGLPLFETAQMLAQIGFDVFQDDGA